MHLLRGASCAARREYSRWRIAGTASVCSDFCLSGWDVPAPRLRAARRPMTRRRFTTISHGSSPNETSESAMLRLTVQAEKQIGKKQWKKMDKGQRSAMVTALFGAERAMASLGEPRPAACVRPPRLPPSAPSSSTAAVGGYSSPIKVASEH